MLKQLRFFALAAVLAVVTACGGGNHAAEQTSAADAIVANNPADYEAAIAEAVRGYHLILDEHVDHPDGARVLSGGLKAASQVATAKLPAPVATPGSDEEIADALAALIAAVGKPDDVIYAFIEGMASALNDRHTTFLRPDVWQDFSQNKVAYTGYKSISGTRGSLVWIVDPGSPAADAGLRPGDTILSVNGVSLAEGSNERTPPQVIGRQVSLSISRPGESDRMLKLTPQSQASAIQTRMIEGGIGYVRITGFVPPGSSQAFLDTLDRELLALSEQRPIGWVLDLRSNGGGLVRLAAQTAARFGFTGTFAETITRDARPETFRSPDPVTRAQPIVVLINRRTGSSAEMLTTALRDSGLVRVVGESSAGSVRLANYFEVSGGALQITTADVKSGPYRRSLEGFGVTPDITIKVDAAELAAGVDAQLLAAVSLLAGD